MRTDTALQQTPNHHFIFSKREPSAKVCPLPAQTLASISRTRGGEQTAATKELVWSLERPECWRELTALSEWEKYLLERRDWVSIPSATTECGSYVVAGIKATHLVIG